LYDFADDFADDFVFPASLPGKLDQLRSFAPWAAACRAHDSVRMNDDPEMGLRRIRERLGKTRNVSTV
jgi:hypothetical protein